MATTQGMRAEVRTVEVRQLGYIFSVSILSKNRFVITLARPTPRALPWLAALRSRKQVRCTSTPPWAYSVEKVPVMLGSTPVPE